MGVVGELAASPAACVFTLARHSSSVFSGSLGFLTGLPHAAPVRSLRLPPRTVLSMRHLTVSPRVQLEDDQRWGSHHRKRLQCLTGLPHAVPVGTSRQPPRTVLSMWPETVSPCCQPDWLRADLSFGCVDV